MAKQRRSFAHDVYKPDAAGCLKRIDTVFASYSDPDEMRRSLIGHDGYDADIVVICEKKRAPEER